MSGTVSYLKAATYKEQVSRSNAWGHHFLFLNIILALLESFTYIYAAPSTSTFISFFYLIVTFLGHTSFLCFIVYLVIYFPLSFIGNFRYYRVFAVIIAILLHTVLLFDVKLYLVAKIHLGTSALNLMFTSLDFKTGLNYNFLYLAIPIVIATELVFAKLTTRYLYKGKHKLSIKVIALVLFCSFVSSHSIHIWADATGYEKVTNLRYVFPAHYPMTARSFLVSHGYEVSSDDTAFLKTPITYPLATIENSELTDTYNIISININGLSNNELTAELTPNLLKLKLTAQNFNNYYLPYTKVSDNLFSASYSMPISYRDSVINENIQPLIINFMQRLEYTNEVLVSSVHNLNSYNLLTNLGLRQNQMESLSSDGLTIDAAISQIRTWPTNERSNSLFILLNDMLKDNISYEGYKARLSLVDRRIGEFLKNLESLSLRNNTVVIISALQGSPFVKDNNEYFVRQRQNVPLMILWPGNGHSGNVQNICSVYDLAPTLASELLGVTSSSQLYSIGYNLNMLPEREFIVCDVPELMLVSPRYTTVYLQSGRAFIENRGQKLSVRPNLENLVEAMRILNRFKE